MSTKFSNTDPYPLSPDGVIDMLSDPEYLTAKYTALGDVTFSVQKQERTEDSLLLQVSRTVRANLPDFAKKVFGETVDVLQTENWRRDGDKWVADATIDNPGKPTSMTAKYVLSPDGSGSSWRTDFEAKASVPLIGGKLEKTLAEETKASLGRELAFNKEWISNH